MRDNLIKAHLFPPISQYDWDRNDKYAMFCLCDIFAKEQANLNRDLTRIQKVQEFSDGVIVMSLDDNFEKLNYDVPLVATAVEVPTNGDDNRTSFRNQNSFKRPRTEVFSEFGMYSSNKLSNYLCSESRNYTRAKTFLSVRHNSYIYHTEDWKPKGCTMYLPLCEDIMINTQNIEQISFETDQFFLADEKGNYVGAKPGNAVHLWRFDSTMKKMYISRSILFLKEQDFHDIQFQLGYL